MSVYGNSIELSQHSINEGFFNKSKDWKTSNEKAAVQKFSSNRVTEEEYDRLIELNHIMRTCETFKEYRKAFNEFCKYCHIVPNGTIIKKLSIKSGKEKDHNSLYVEYGVNTKKIQLPEGTKLYHITKVDGIKELIPVFRGKSVTGYLYDRHRVYLTIHKNIPKFLADYDRKDKLYKYEVTQDIKDVYVDPLVRMSFQGAVYVVTDKPIKVEEVGIPK